MSLVWVASHHWRECDGGEGIPIGVYTDPVLAMVDASDPYEDLCSEWTEWGDGFLALVGRHDWVRVIPFELEES